MKVLYIGDIMGARGLEAVKRCLPEIKKTHDLDLVIAQAENVSEGRGTTKEDFLKLRNLGIDFCTGGNWSLNQPDIYDYFADPVQPIIRPANYPAGTPGRGWKELETKNGKVQIISLLGSIVGKDSAKPMENPLKIVDEILQDTKDIKYIARVVNFHGDYSSEKVVIGYYLDGRVSVVVGDHWHVPTADAMVLPKGTAHVTDVGMCGALHSSLGVKTEVIIRRWKENKASRNELESKGPMQFNAVLSIVDTGTGLATDVNHIQKIID